MKKAFFLIILASLCFANGLFSQNRKIDSLKSILNTSDDSRQKVNLLESIASNYLYLNPVKSREYAGQMEKLARELAFEKDQARSLRIIGNSYWMEGNYNQAIQYYFQSLRKYEAIADFEGVMMTFNNIGEAYKKQGEHELGLDYLNKALDIGIEHELTDKSILVYNNIGEVYYKQGDLEASLKYHSIALEMAREFNDDKTIAYGYNGIGNIYKKKGEFRTALGFHRKAIDIRKKIHDRRGEASSGNALGELYIFLGNYRFAGVYLNNAKIIIEEIGAKDLAVENYRLLSELEMVKGNFVKSLNYYKTHSSYKDSVVNAEIAEKIARVSASYMSEVKERENELLKKEKEAKEAKIKAQSVLIIAGAIGLFLLVILAWVLYRQASKRKKANALLRRKNREIERQNDEISLQAEELQSLNETLNSLNQRLESKVKDSTALVKMQHIQLLEYAFINAHKLRPPLASILGLVNLIQYTDLNSHDEEIIQHLKISAIELDEIVSDIREKLEKDERVSN